jgi:hypothetical protein
VPTLENNSLKTKHLSFLFPLNCESPANFDKPVHPQPLEGNARELTLLCLVTSGEVAAPFGQAWEKDLEGFSVGKLTLIWPWRISPAAERTDLRTIPSLPEITPCVLD